MPSRKPYANYPKESSFMSQDSVSSRTPLTADRESPTSLNELYGHDINAENPYELPINFEMDRVRHESEMIERRNLNDRHKKKPCLLYEAADGHGLKNGNGKIRRQFSDEEDSSEIRFMNPNAKTNKCIFILLFLLVFVAMGMGALGVLAFLDKKSSSSTTWTQKSESQSTQAIKGWYDFCYSCIHDLDDFAFCRLANGYFFIHSTFVPIFVFLIHLPMDIKCKVCVKWREIN